MQRRGPVQQKAVRGMDTLGDSEGNRRRRDTADPEERRQRDLCTEGAGAADQERVRPGEMGSGRRIRKRDGAGGAGIPVVLSDSW